MMELDEESIYEPDISLFHFDCRLSFGARISLRMGPSLNVEVYELSFNHVTSRHLQMEYR